MALCDGPDRAIPHLADLLEMQTRRAGGDHADMICTLYNLAHWEGERGEPRAAAEQMFTIVQGLRYSSGLPPDHPTVLMARGAEAYWRGSAGDYRGGAAALERVLDEQVRVLGHDHIDTLRSGAALAEWLGRSGDQAGAVLRTEQLIAAQERVFGPEDRKLVQTRQDLDYWRHGGTRVRHVWASADLVGESLQASMRPVWAPEPLIGYQARAHWALATGDRGRGANRDNQPIARPWSNSVRARP